MEHMTKRTRCWDWEAGQIKSFAPDQTESVAEPEAEPRHPELLLQSLCFPTLVCKAVYWASSGTSPPPCALLKSLEKLTHGPNEDIWTTTHEPWL